jgi:hypothetical protein
VRQYSTLDKPQQQPQRQLSGYPDSAGCPDRLLSRHTLRTHVRDQTLFFSNGGGIPLEHCTVTDDRHACALEYNVVRWGRTELPPEAGVAVYVRGNNGRLAVARIYDDSDPPLTPQV